MDGDERPRERKGKTPGETECLRALGRERNTDSTRKAAEQHPGTRDPIVNTALGGHSGIIQTEVIMGESNDICKVYYYIIILRNMDMVFKVDDRSGNGRSKGKYEYQLKQGSHQIDVGIIIFLKKQQTNLHVIIKNL